jgi:hypothetical protein
MKWDIFVSHASEDKEIFVEPLAKRLRRNGYKVWYDKFCLQVGDSVRRSIEKGLIDSKYGLVVLSKNFFSKKWPQRELDSLLSMEDEQNARILPVWLGINHNEVCKFSPLLADKFALNASDGIDSIIEKLKERIIVERFISHEDFNKSIEIFYSSNKYSKKS